MAHVRVIKLLVFLVNYTSFLAVLRQTSLLEILKWSPNVAMAVILYRNINKMQININFIGSYFITFMYILLQSVAEANYVYYKWITTCVYNAKNNSFSEQWPVFAVYCHISINYLGNIFLSKFFFYWTPPPYDTSGYASTPLVYSACKVSRRSVKR